jgi:putative RNA 2'-phosphotransferase
VNRELIRTSKFLSLVLRHQPEVIGLVLDEHGWAEIDALIEAANRSGKSLTRELLFRVVRENDKQRFALSDDQTKIRASQGHSIGVDLGLEPVEPPGVLFHGTIERFLASIRREGLKPGSRQHVHLSPDAVTAAKVGQRRGTPIILEVRASEMHGAGFRFYLSANGVWLADHVPAKYICFPES